jgi:hypothetical protein
MKLEILFHSFALAIALSATPAVADGNGLMSTKELCEMCTPLSAEWERTKDQTGSGQMLMTTICNSFLQGVVSYDYTLVTSGARKATVCPSAGIIMADAKRVFLEYCENHPEAGKYEGSSSFMAALQAVYPCQNAR